MQRMQWNRNNCEDTHAYSSTLLEHQHFDQEAQKNITVDKALAAVGDATGRETQLEVETCNTTLGKDFSEAQLV